MTTLALENEPPHHIIHAVHSSVKMMAPALSGRRGRVMVVLRVGKTPADIIASRGAPYREPDHGTGQWIR
ncbi:hypothetical protein F07S3_72730 [Bradyrhizobium diazoefficiens]|nr:hypothetical protein F07S3_72730 [Bradyrhizobium diazoefficiens]BCF02985.1 hypothetical protein XF11B_70050 [Bradyrhizobium diazoefficiens]BCF11667.1 hypothetical protein XF12B_70400 [Bradyrhizobium diazoefficiens]